MFVTLILFALTEALFSASPGPAVALVISAFFVAGWRSANAAILGILAGNMIYFIAAGFFIITASGFSEDVLLYLKIGGAIYLAYLLATEYIFKSSAEEGKPANSDVEKNNQRSRKFFLSALAMQIANPKTILFFTAFLPQFISTEMSIILQIGILGLISASVEYIVLLIYVLIAYTVSKRITPKVSNSLGHIGNVTMVMAVIWGVFFI